MHAWFGASPFGTLLHVVMVAWIVHRLLTIRLDVGSNIVACGLHQHSIIDLLSSTLDVVVLVRVDEPPAPSQAVAPPQAASASTTGSNSKDAGSGFTDVVMPPETTAGAAPASHQAHDEGAVPGNARQDAAEPEATLPGGSATGGPHAEPEKSHNAKVHSKQRQLDWSAAASKKRKASGVTEAASHIDDQQQSTKPRQKRQCKLKVSTK